MNYAISLDTAALVTGVSKRTLWRRLDDGKITRQENDSRGRAMLTLADLLPMLCVSVDPEDYELLADADAGNADEGSISYIFYLFFGSLNNLQN